MQDSTVEVTIEPQVAIDVVAGIFRQMAENPTALVTIKFQGDFKIYDTDTGIPCGAVPSVAGAVEDGPVLDDD